MSDQSPQVYPLIPSQMCAVEPDDNIWLSASAGTGKTQVLTARVIRLLMAQDVSPENLLCITFTKAGAAEMAERINRLLASWVQKKGDILARELKAIGADFSPEAQERARQLFAKVLDAPGGGLQILTIHSLCQSLLGSFPEEAGLVPGFKPVEGREQDELYRDALSELILAAETRSDGYLIGNLQTMSLAMGEDSAIKFLQKCASQPQTMLEIPDDKGAVAMARSIAGVSFDGPTNSFLENACSDHIIDRKSIETIAVMNEIWSGGKTESRGGKRAAIIRQWLTSDPQTRAANFSDIHLSWSKQDGDPLIKSNRYTPTDESYAEIALELHHWSNAILGQIRLADYAERLAGALLVGKAYSAHYAEAKRARGLVDFDDMIRKTANLLNTSNMAEWVRYKLDRQIDHILIDEAQDTNAAQWDILKALSDDFFSGITAKESKIRTVFSVGDYKQAIFGFQGTDPAQYAEAGQEFAARIGESGSELKQLALSQSFRSTRPVLDFVNAVIAQAGPERFGIETAIEDHYSANADIGMIELFSPVLPSGEAENGGDDEEQWLSSEKRILAHRIAAYVRKLVDEKPVLQSTGKPLVAGDIMILLRARGEMASLLVSRLHAAGVPVAGIDRLKLQEPIAVQDMLSTVRFALQPEDDLSLACLMVSPLIGWTHEKLLEFGYRKPDSKLSLWRHLRDTKAIAADIQPLREILASADFTTPYHFLEQILSGPIQGRKKMQARLGSETLVPIEELLNAALHFEQNLGGGLQAFLAWFEHGESIIKREEAGGANEVRVMTVHGAKGLEAPVVILADVTADPTKRPDNVAELLVDEGRRLPLLGIKKNERIGRLADVVEKQELRDLNEHYRLLYVAITRAKERLVMAGSLGQRSNGLAAEYSWFPALQSGMEALGVTWQQELPWERVMRYIGKDKPKDKISKAPSKTGISEIATPDWLVRPAPEEIRPPRPLVPSQLDDDEYGEAPASPALSLAAHKGRLIHALFERLSGEDIEENLAKAQSWLHVNNDNKAISNDEILGHIRPILANPIWAIFFGPEVKAEVPLAAVVGETVISGRVDRLVIGATTIHVLDFKTGRHIPESEAELPRPFLRQMAHYVAALEVIFPRKRVEASLLYTRGPQLVTLSDAILAPHKPNS